MLKKQLANSGDLTNRSVNLGDQPSDAVLRMNSQLKDAKSQLFDMRH